VDRRGRAEREAETACIAHLEVYHRDLLRECLSHAATLPTHAAICQAIVLL